MQKLGKKTDYREIFKAVKESVRNDAGLLSTGLVAAICSTSGFYLSGLIKNALENQPAEPGSLRNAAERLSTFGGWGFATATVLIVAVFASDLKHTLRRQRDARYASELAETRTFWNKVMAEGRRKNERGELERDILGDLDEPTPEERELFKSLLQKRPGRNGEGK